MKKQIKIEPAQNFIPENEYLFASKGDWYIGYYHDGYFTYDDYYFTYDELDYIFDLPPLQEKQ